MLVRDYTPADVDACLRVFDSNVPDFFALSERADYRLFLDGLITPYLVLEDAAGDVAACGGYALNADGTLASLCWGMVRGRDHRKGIGRVLLRERLRRIAADPRVLSIRLDTTQHARGFYEGAGFRVTTLTPDGYAPGFDRYDMRLDRPWPAF